jgi:hypothetical protein
MSDEFDLERERIKRLYSHLPADALTDVLEDKNSYGETFYVPKIARWNESYLNKQGQTVPALKDVKKDVGERLNEAIAAIEENNTPLLDGVLKIILISTRPKERAKSLMTAGLSSSITSIKSYSLMKTSNSRIY